MWGINPLPLAAETDDVKVLQLLLILIFFGKSLA